MQQLPHDQVARRAYEISLRSPHTSPEANWLQAERELLSCTPGYEHYTPREHLSVSSLVNFKRCPRRYFYASGCRLVLPNEHPALKFGEAIHTAIPEITGANQDQPIEARAANAMSKFNAVWADTQGDDTRNSENAARVLADFASSHTPKECIYELLPAPAGSLELAAQLKLQRVSAWEIPFAINIPGLRVPLVGRIDGLCRMRYDQSVWGLEYKTSRQLGTNFFAGFDLSPQVIAYTLALRTYLGEDSVRGCIVEGIRTSKTNSASSAVPVPVADHHIDHFIRWARFTGNMILECEAQQDFPMDFAGCHPYAQFGVHGYPCDYMQLCKHTDDWRDMRAGYMVKDDRPFVLMTLNGKDLGDQA